MKIIHFDRKEGLMKVKPNNADDLYVLSKIIEAGDLVSGETIRRIKLSGEDEKSRSAKKKFYATIEAEKVSFDNILRISGKIIEGSGELPHGSFHTLDVGANDVIKIQKKWREYQIKKLENAEKNSSRSSVLVCILDDDEANLAVLSQSGIRHLGHFSLGLVKKRIKENRQEEKLKKLADEIILQASNQKPQTLILASPIFWKENLLKALKEKNPELAKKARLEDVSTGMKKGITELINRGALEKVLKESQLQKEALLVENLLFGISKNSAEYGFPNVKSAVESGNAKTLLISENFLQDSRMKNSEKLDALLDSAEQNKCEVHIISSDSEAGMKLDGLGGIACLIR